MAGGPSMVADCGARQARLRLASRAAANGHDKAAAGEWAVPHLRADKLGGITGEPDKPLNPGLQCWEIKPQTSD